MIHSCEERMESHQSFDSSTRVRHARDMIVAASALAFESVVEPSILPKDWSN